MRLGGLQEDAKKSRAAKSAAKKEAGGDSRSNRANSVKVYALNAEVAVESGDPNIYSLRAKPAPEASEFIQAVTSKRVREVFLRGGAFAIEYAGSEGGVLSFKLDPEKAESPFLTSAPTGAEMATGGFARVYVMAH
jgi:hypothetical protein